MSGLIMSEGVQEGSIHEGRVVPGCKSSSRTQRIGMGVGEFFKGC